MTAIEGTRNDAILERIFFFLRSFGFSKRVLLLIMIGLRKRT